MILLKNKVSSASISSTIIQYFIIDENNYLIKESVLKEKYAALYGRYTMNNCNDTNGSLGIWNDNMDSNYTNTLLKDGLFMDREGQVMDVLSSAGTYCIFHKNPEDLSDNTYQKESICKKVILS